MANQMRWRYGETNPVMVPVDSATVIEIGDLLYLDTDDAKPASASGADRSIRVATTGVFELDCAAATFEVGDLVGAVENGGGTALEDQKGVGVATPNLAIGRCAKRENPAATSVYVDVVSTVLRGGPQAAA